MIENFQHYCKPSSVLNTHQLEFVQRFVEVCKSYVKESAERLVKHAGDVCLLIQRQGDGTWTKTKEKHVFGHDKLKVQRAGGQGCDFFMSRTIVSTMDQRCMIIDEPRAMTQGKDSWCAFAAMAESFPTCRRMGHQGFAINFYCYDRLQFTKMMMIHEADHRKSCADLALELGDPDAENDLIMKDLTLGRACADHDAHNGLKWALHPFHLESADKTFKELHIGIASARNSWDILMKEFPDWLISVVRFTDEPFDADISYQLWVSLQVASCWVEELLELEVRFEDSHLKLKKAFEETDWVDRVTTVLMAIWTFKEFTASRWLTQGDSCRTLVCAGKTGFDSLMAKTLDNPKHSKYYLHGWNRIDNNLREFMVLSSFVSYVPDAFLTETLADDRVALNLDSLKETVWTEFEYLWALDLQVWHSFSVYCDVGAYTLRHKALCGSMRALGFLAWRVFVDAEALPWSLCRGDVMSNLRTLADSAQPPTQHTAKKIYHWARMAPEIPVPVVEQLGQCGWSSKMAEQAHAPVTRLIRLHPEYQSSAVTCRATLISFNQLFSMTDAEKKFARVHAKLQALRRKMPSRCGGRQAYNKAMIEEAQRQKRKGKHVPVDIGQKIVAGTGKIWKEMTENNKEKFRSSAAILVDERTAQLTNDIGDAEQTLLTARSRVADEADRSSGPITVSSCKFTPAQKKQIHHLLQDPKFKGDSLCRLREAATQPPNTEQSRIAEIMAFEQKHHIKKQQPSWARPVSVARDLFHDSIWSFALQGSSTPFCVGKFLFAYQNPVVVCFFCFGS